MNSRGVTMDVKLSDVFAGKIRGLERNAELGEVSSPLPKGPFGSNDEIKAKTAGTFGSENVTEKILGDFQSFTDHNKKIFGDVEGQSWKSMNQQKNLPLFGDYDKDKVLNVFDCDPFDKNKQANWHETFKQAGKKVWNAAVTQPLEEKRKEREYIKGIREEAKEEALKEIQKEKVAQVYSSEKDRLMKKAGVAPQRPKMRSSPTGTMLGRSQTFNDVTGGLRQSANDFASGLAAAPITWGNRVDQIIGLRTGPTQGMLTMASLRPQDTQLPQTAQPMSQMGQPMMQPTQEGVESGPRGPPPKPGMVWSERTKDWVSYTRGSYDKKPKVIYQQRPQPPQQYQQY